jgi:hypothetical protein
MKKSAFAQPVTGVVTYGRTPASQEAFIVRLQGRCPHGRNQIRRS